MSFNPRMSIIPPYQQQKHHNHHNRSARQKDVADLFVRLTDKEIVACVADMGIPFTVADLQKPNPLLVQKIFEWFAEELLNVTRATVEPAMRAAAEEVCSEYYGPTTAGDDPQHGAGDALFPPDTRCLLGFCASLRVLLSECCVRDFSFADLYRPTYDRLVMILSYLINFVRFREGQGHIVDEHATAKLQPYVLQSPAALQASLADLSSALAAHRAHAEALERRARALQTSADAFGVGSGEVAACSKLLEEIAGELAREEDDNAKKTRQRDALTERGADVKEVERAELLLQKQLAKWHERMARLREQSAQKAQEAQAKMEELKQVHRTLNEERTEKGRDIEKRRVRIEQTEKKMLDLKENIENEVRNAYDEYLKMEAHIKLYITEMEQTM
ncbi:kinetochore protein nuf2 [Niveomyces insectorum RCEF 264]|uniref:Probable kinetochore protein NUF2 n=1 Tax=Niveomyces insectorum RCEF 264 TaxID=1081102 RepID=A0A167PV56_9HYPO|nr:kinetochore protein nuf2 [Niveomyces insectorum RCEF 264]